MYTLSKSKYSFIKTFLLGILAILLAVSIVMFPDAAFQASVKGLKIWWDIIFPALLPFFITSEILLGFGVVHFLGVLLEPLMKPLFNVPGAGAFVLAMGFASGYPMGAKLTARLREQNMISKIEGERLVSFTSTSDPLFLFGAIAVGFFHDADLGIILASIHYISSIIVGLIMRFYKKNNQLISPVKVQKTLKNNLIIKAFKEMYQARLKDGRKLGKLMGDAVMSSMETLLMIGGFIMIFSVILTILDQVKITLLFSKIISLLLLSLGISEQFSSSVIFGFFEVTLGAKSVSEIATSIPLIQKIAIVGAISAWSGISVHAQVAAILQKTDIKYSPYLFARLMHTILAFTLSIVALKHLNIDSIANSLPAFMYQLSNHDLRLSVWDSLNYLSISLLVFTIVLFLLSLLFHILKKN